MVRSLGYFYYYITAHVATTKTTCLCRSYIFRCGGAVRSLPSPPRAPPEAHESVMVFVRLLLLVCEEKISTRSDEACQRGVNPAIKNLLGAVVIIHMYNPVADGHELPTCS